MAIVTGAKVWTHDRSGDQTFRVSLMDGATELAGVDRANSGTTRTWGSATYTGTLNQTQVDGLTIKAVVTSQAGTVTPARIYELYIELITDAGSTFLDPDGNSGTPNWSKDNGALLHWEHVDDGTRQPTLPVNTASDYWFSSTVGNSAEVTVTTVTVNSTTSASASDSSTMTDSSSVVTLLDVVSSDGITFTDEDTTVDVTAATAEGTLSELAVVTVATGDFLVVEAYAMSDVSSPAATLTARTDAATFSDVSSVAISVGAFDSVTLSETLVPDANMTIVRRAQRVMAGCGVTSPGATGIFSEF